MASAVAPTAALLGHAVAQAPSARPASFMGRPLPAVAHPAPAPLFRRRALSVTARAGGGGGSNTPLQAPYQPFRVINQEEEGGYGSALTAQEQLQILRERQGLWHELARVVPLLLRSGYSPNAIDAETGLTGAEQNRWTVAAQVLESLRAAGMDPDALGYFDVDGADVLYELRILNNTQRRQAAEYILDNNSPSMEAKSVGLLARAIKDHERKRGGSDRDFFAPTPADCLAYLYYRQALEATTAFDKETYVEQGLAVASSDAAKQKLQTLLSRAGQADSAASADDHASASVSTTPAEITVVGVADDDLRSAIVPVLGNMAALSANQLRSAPAMANASALGVFSLSSSTPSQWVALPQWPALADRGTRLVALLCPTPAPVAAFVRVSKAQQGQPILLVVDLDDQEAQPSCCSLAADQEGALSVVAGSQKLVGREIVGRVILGIRRAPVASVVDGLDD
eukprot:jgi/Chlat1/4638/Chrsp3S05593